MWYQEQNVEKEWMWDCEYKTQKLIHTDLIPCKHKALSSLSFLTSRSANKNWQQARMTKQKAHISVLSPLWKDKKVQMKID